MIPPTISALTRSRQIWQAASSNNSLWIIFVRACVVLTVIVGYTGFSYRVFLGKATALQ